jgi:hypothetical protein
MTPRPKEPTISPDQASDRSDRLFSGRPSAPVVAGAGERNCGLIAVFCLPRDQPFVLQSIESEDSKLDAKVQKTMKVIVRILAGHTRLVSVVFMDGDSCTSPVHRIDSPLREALW